MAGKKLVPQHQEPTDEELAARAEDAFNLEQEIIELAKSAQDVWWKLAEKVWEFQEKHYWKERGCDSLNEWLANPELAILSSSRSDWMRKHRLWQRFAIEQAVPPGELEKVPPRKLDEVVPAVVHGKVKVEDALADVKALSKSDLITKYDISSNDDGTLDASKEPEYGKCPTCGSWVPEQRLPDVIEGEAEEK